MCLTNLPLLQCGGNGWTGPTVQLLGTASGLPLSGSAPHLRAKPGLPMGVLPVLPVTLHWKPFIYTGKKNELASRRI